MINTDRLKEDIEALRRMTDPCDGGVTRIGFTPTYRKGVEHVKQRMLEIGLTVYEDEVGNIHGVLEGTDKTAPFILSGSHLDTVRNAGAFDGIAGVVCALEAARQLKEQGHSLKHSFEIIGFIEEEGTYTGQFMLGSRFISGDLTDKDKDAIGGEDNLPLRKVLETYMDGVATQPACRKNDNFLAFLEVHDEQGPVLAETGIDIGIVENIVALAQLTVTVTGFAGHAGTVPMHMRQDAGLAACTLVTDMTAYVQRHYSDATTLTVGKLNLLPASSNCIPGQSVFTIDVRSSAKSTIEAIVTYIQQLAALVETSHRVSVSVVMDTIKESVSMDKGLQEVLTRSCEKLGLSYRPINSGAGHDAMIMATLCPTAMIFIPCEKGITHHPLEKVDWEDMGKGTALLLETILELDRQSI